MNKIKVAHYQKTRRGGDNFMKRKKHIDDAARRLANAMRDIDDAIALSNGMQRATLVNARRDISNAQHTLQEAANQ